MQAIWKLLLGPKEKERDGGKLKKTRGKDWRPSRGCLLKEGAAVNPEGETGLGEEESGAFFGAPLAPAFELARGNAASPPWKQEKGGFG